MMRGRVPESVAKESARPVTCKTKRLEDGMPYYGMLGELAYDAEEDKVQCHLCGGWYRAIGGSHGL